MIKNKIEIIAHRGFWLGKFEKNSLKAFNLALKKGFGIETDLRDLDGKLVISHDPPTKTEGLIEFNNFLKIFKEKNKNFALAINIKSDGIAKNIYDICLSEEICNFFIFDMSIPDLIYSYQLGCKNLFLRLSEYEDPSFIPIEAEGLWVDFFKGIFPKDEELLENLNKYSKIAFVSPELHGHSVQLTERFWLRLNSFVKNNFENKRFFLCTDYPQQAFEFFNQ